MGKVWMIASGKGGVGKSSLTAGLAVVFAGRGMRTLIVDADIGLRNLDLMLGLQDKVLFELADCLEKRCSLEDAMVPHVKYPSLYLLAGGQTARPSDFGRSQMSKVFSTLKKYFDIILVDCPAGIGRGFRNIMSVADECILVATPDDVCLRDTEKTAKILFEAKALHPHLILNRTMVAAKNGAASMAKSIADSLDVTLLGAIPNDEKVYAAMLEGKTMAEAESTKVTKALLAIASRMQGLDVPFEDERGSALSRWFRRLKEGKPRVYNEN